MNQSLNQLVNKSLRLLKNVESREWHDILLSSSNPTRPAEEAVKLRQIANCFVGFMDSYPDASIEEQKEAYQMMRIAFAAGMFPRRKLLSKDQFGLILDCHLESLR